MGTVHQLFKDNKISSNRGVAYITIRRYVDHDEMSTIRLIEADGHILFEADSDTITDIMNPVKLLKDARTEIRNGYPGAIIEDVRIMIEGTINGWMPLTQAVAYLIEDAERLDLKDDCKETLIKLDEDLIVYSSSESIDQ